jgi:hypothetical protein
MCRVTFHDQYNVGCQALTAIGFDLTALPHRIEGGIPSGDDPEGSGVKVVEAADAPFVAYHNLFEGSNGRKIGVQGAWYGDAFWHEQGDWDGGQRATVQIKGAYLSKEKPKGRYLTWYNDRGREAFIDGTQGEAQYLALCGSPRGLLTGKSYASWGYVGQREGDNPICVKNVYVPTYELADGTTRGPFEQLLFPMLSSGTPGANHAKYDACPLDLSVNIPACLVDIESFLEADRIVAASPLAQRPCYVIEGDDKR